MHTLFIWYCNCNGLDTFYAFWLTITTSYNQVSNGPENAPSISNQCQVCIRNDSIVDTVQEMHTVKSLLRAAALINFGNFR